MVAQTMPAVPGALWQRLFLAIWLLGCLVVTTAYTCDLVRVFTRVAYDSRLVGIGAFAAVSAFFDILFGVVPGAACVIEHDCQDETCGKSACQKSHYACYS